MDKLSLGSKTAVRALRNTAKYCVFTILERVHNQWMPLGLVSIYLIQVTFEQPCNNT